MASEKRGGQNILLFFIKNSIHGLSQLIISLYLFFSIILIILVINIAEVSPIFIFTN